MDRRDSSEDIPNDVEEEDEGKVDEAGKAVYGFCATHGTRQCATIGLLYWFPPGEAGFLHAVSWAAISLSGFFYSMLELYSLVASMAPSRPTMRNKKNIAGCSHFLFMVSVFTRVCLELPRRVIVLIGVGLLIIAIFLSYVWESPRHPNRRKSKSSQVSPADKTVHNVLNAKANRPQVYGAKSATEGTDITQGSMPVKGDGGLPTPTGDPSAQSSQGDNHPSSRVEKQEIESAEAVKPYEERIIEEQYDMEKAIKPLNEFPAESYDYNC